MYLFVAANDKQTIYFIFAMPANKTTPFVNDIKTLARHTTTLWFNTKLQLLNCNAFS